MKNPLKFPPLLLPIGSEDPWSKGRRELASFGSGERGLVRKQTMVPFLLYVGSGVGPMMLGTDEKVIPGW